MNKYQVLLNVFKYTIGLPVMVLLTITFCIAFPLIYLCEKECALKELLEFHYHLWKVW